MIIRDAESEEDAEILIARCVADPVIVNAGQVARYSPCCFLFLPRISSVGRVRAESRIGQATDRSSDFNEGLHALQTRPCGGE